jgi:hypothetical protein
MGQLDRAVRDSRVAPLANNFVWTQSTNPQLVQEFKVGDLGTIVVLDPDGNEISRGGWTDGAELARTLDVAVKRWQPREIKWTDKLPEGPTDKPVAAVWLDDKSGSKDVLKLLQEPWMARLHDKFIWVKIDADSGKSWKATNAPALFVLDPAQPEEKRILERAAGVRPIGVFHEALVNALKKFEKSKK